MGGVQAEVGGVDVLGGTIWHEVASSGCVEMIDVLLDRYSRHLTGWSNG